MYSSRTLYTHLLKDTTYMYRYFKCFDQCYWWIFCKVVAFEKSYLVSWHMHRIVSHKENVLSHKDTRLCYTRTLNCVTLGQLAQYVYILIKEEYLSLSPATGNRIPLLLLPFLSHLRGQLRYGRKLQLWHFFSQVRW